MRAMVVMELDKIDNHHCKMHQTIFFNLASYESVKTLIGKRRMCDFKVLNNNQTLAFSQPFYQLHYTCFFHLLTQSILSNYPILFWIEAFKNQKVELEKIT